MTHQLIVMSEVNGNGARLVERINRLIQELAEIRDAVTDLYATPIAPEPAEVKEVVRCGYMNPCEIQTFPIAGREAFIYIRRRRWKEKGGRESFFNTHKYTIEGIKCTPKFGAFLKEIGRGEADKHW